MGGVDRVIRWCGRKLLGALNTDHESEFQGCNRGKGNLSLLIA